MWRRRRAPDRSGHGRLGRRERAGRVWRAAAAAPTTSAMASSSCSTSILPRSTVRTAQQLGDQATEPTDQGRRSATRGRPADDVVTPDQIMPLQRAVATSAVGFSSRRQVGCDRRRPAPIQSLHERTHPGRHRIIRSDRRPEHEQMAAELSAPAATGRRSPCATSPWYRSASMIPRTRRSASPSTSRPTRRRRPCRLEGQPLRTRWRGYRIAGAGARSRPAQSRHPPAQQAVARRGPGWHSPRWPPRTRAPAQSRRSGPSPS